MKHVDNIKALLALMRASTSFHALVVVSPPGWGKSTTVDGALRELDLAHHALGSYTTPLALYEALCARPRDILVLDDCAGLFSAAQAMAVLKAATWPSAGGEGSRRVAWASSSERVSTPECVFEGKLVLLANALPRRLEAEAFLSRALLYRIAFDDADVAELLRAGARSEDHFSDTAAAAEVAEFLIEDVLRHHGASGLNFRALRLGYELRRDAPSNWRELLMSLLTTQQKLVQDPRELVRELGATPLSVDEQVARFVRATGLSRRSFQVYRRALGLSRRYAHRRSADDAVPATDTATATEPPQRS